MGVLVDDILRAKMTFRNLDQSICMNTWWFKVVTTGTTDNADIFEGVSDFMVAFYGGYDAVVSTNYQSYLLTVDKVSPTVGPWEVLENIGIDYLVGGDIAGSESTTDDLPPQSALLMSLQALLRKHSGRKYLGGLTELSNDPDGGIASSTTTAMISPMAQVLVDHAIPNTLAELRVVIPNMAGFATNEVSVCTVSSIWRSQRRRQTSVGI